jgi:hypothetical protein
MRRRRAGRGRNEQERGGIKRNNEEKGWNKEE